MTVKELKAILETMSDGAEVVLGCQGYTTETADEIRARQSGRKVYLTDCCYYADAEKALPQVEIEQCARGYNVRIRRGGLWLYVEKIYKGKISLVRDYTFSKAYKDINTAQEVADRLAEQERG